jgi:hypothetical protein
MTAHDVVTPLPHVVPQLTNNQHQTKLVSCSRHDLRTERVATRGEARADAARSGCGAGNVATTGHELEQRKCVR